VETGDYQNSMLLKFEDDSVGKSSHSSTPTSPVDDGQLQWVLGDTFDSICNSQREAVSKLRPYGVIPYSGVSQLLFRLS
jgi:hypothetical protein